MNHSHVSPPVKQEANFDCVTGDLPLQPVFDEDLRPAPMQWQDKLVIGACLIAAIFIIVLITLFP
ncbi:MAG: hypothetical protein LBV49_10855 [Azonexus sp.]|jgi:hypothetical protein|nr:hypothetical protein [Azonexus sp.]